MNEKIFLPLQAGRRFNLESEKGFALLKHGNIEVYAVMRGEGSFRQEFLTELAEGEAAFPALDEFEQIETIIYAVEDSEIEILQFENIPAPNCEI